MANMVQAALGTSAGSVFTGVEIWPEPETETGNEQGEGPEVGSAAIAPVLAPDGALGGRSESDGPACVNMRLQTERVHQSDGESEKTCATSGCAGERLFRFNNQWVCSGVCVERLVLATVLEEQTRATAKVSGAWPRVQLGRILIEQGTINEAQLEQALRSQQATGAGRLGCWLKQQVELPEAEFTAALSIQWRCPVFRIGTFAAAPMASYLPRPLIEEHGALPLRLTGSPQRLSLCFEDHVDYELMHAAERMHGIAVDAGLLTATEFWQVTRDLLSVRFPAVAEMETSSLQGMAQAFGRFLVAAHPAEARMVAVDNCYWLRLWQPVAGTAFLPQPALVPYDILCTLRESRPAAELPSHAADLEVDSLTRQMLRVLF